MTCYCNVCNAIRRRYPAIADASADTRPEGGDATEIAAPFTSGAVGEAETPKPSQGAEQQQCRSGR